MYLGGLSYAGTLTRPSPGPARASGADPAETPAARAIPGYFRTISSISHASLASAYQAMRAHELTMVPVDKPLAGEPNQEISVAAGAISSGAGIPGAMAAYAETMEPEEV